MAVKVWLISTVCFYLTVAAWIVCAVGVNWFDWSLVPMWVTLVMVWILYGVMMTARCLALEKKGR